MGNQGRESGVGGTRRRWYAAGLRFTCVQECGACCTRHEDYAYVYLEPGDVAKISRHLGLPRREFLNRYTIVDDGDLVLKMDEPQCPFLDGWHCKVYEVRPVQCRTFPFWEETVRSRTTWNRLKRFCPGIDSGELHRPATIERLVAERESEDR